MISMKSLHKGSATKAAHYYADQADDYYGKEGDAAQWQGTGAEALGLIGEVDQRQFIAALRGDFGYEFTNAMRAEFGRSVRHDSKARAGIDITFSAPKSVSIQALIGRDHKVLEAHDKAVTKALAYLEQELMRGRKKENGVSHSERTGNAIIAKFRHETARPSQFDEADPQLHTHSIVMNATQRADGTWVAMSNEQIYKSRKMLDLIYKKEMASELIKAGYTLRHEKDNFELAHINRDQIEHFSKRGMSVEAELAKIGKTRETASSELKQAITLATRQEKRPEVTRDELQAGWEREAKAMGIDFSADRSEAELTKNDSKLSRQHSKTSARATSLNRNQPISFMEGKSGALPDTVNALHAQVALECIDWAIRHHAEREAVISREALMITAMSHSIGTDVTERDLKQAIGAKIRSGHLIQGAPTYSFQADIHSNSVLTRGEWVRKFMREGMTSQQARSHVRREIAIGSLILEDVHYTTQAAREQEKRIQQIEREGRRSMESILTPEAARQAFAEKGLTPGQLAAAEMVLTTENRVVGVQGLAGVGKSYMLGHLKETLESEGYTVKSVAPYGTQVKELRDLGVETQTVSSTLEASQNRFTLDNKTVLVIDEAAVIPTRQMEILQKRAEKVGARVLMVGDIEQTKAIEAGRPMAQLQDAGMETVLMGDIQRQTNEDLKQAVELAAEGQSADSLELLESSVLEISETINRYDQLAEHYASLPVGQQRETLIITGTNASRNDINDLVHEKLGLAGKGFTYNLLVRVDTTQAQRRMAKYYEVGQMLQPDRSYKSGMIQDQQYVIESIDSNRNRLVVKSLSTGETISFNPSRATKISVYQKMETELSAGEQVRITRNNARLDLVNGARYEVMSVTPSTVKLGQVGKNGKHLNTIVLSTDQPLHLDRAYCSTVHSTQGLSANGVILNQETFSRTTKSDVYYVAISRAREWVKIYTDDRSKLPAAISRREEKSAALDIGLARRTSGHQMESSLSAAQPDVHKTKHAALEKG